MTTREANDGDFMINQGISATATVYLALGTNLGDREANLSEAIERIARLGLAITRQSSIYETEPVGFVDQAWFLNQVIEARIPHDLMFSLNAPDAERLKQAWRVDAKTALANQLVLLLDALLAIESEMGRRRTVPNGPRVIDIDILLCDEIAGVFGGTENLEANRLPRWIQSLNGKVLQELILPHPRMHMRRFVLAPLCEIAPIVIHPTLKKSCAELLAALDDQSVVRCFRPAINS